MTKSSKEYFDAIGGGWDDMQERFFSDTVREQALAVAGVEDGGVAADIGAGTGFVTESLLEHGLRVIAVDQSEKMLDALRAKFPPPAQVDCRVGSAEDLPIDTGSVDFVFANMYLHHVEQPAAAVAEMVRIVRPGGRVVITDLDKHEFEFLRVEQYDRWMGFERDDIRRWFADAGLVEVSVDCVGDNCCTKSERGTDVAISIFVASGTSPSGCMAD